MSQLAGNSVAKAQAPFATSAAFQARSSGSGPSGVPAIVCQQSHHVSPPKKPPPPPWTMQVLSEAGEEAAAAKAEEAAAGMSTGAVQ